MAKINQEEYEVLKEVRKDMDGRWHWLARDEKGYLWAYNVKPERKASLGSWGNPPWSLVRNETIFQFIKWEDEEPYSIAELIEEYEREAKDKETDLYTRRMKYIAQAFSNLNSESEKTEVKNIEWAIKEIEGLETESSQNYPHDEMIEKEIVLGILNRLDEPETVEQTTLLLENVLKENKRLGKLLEEKHEEWLNLTDKINNQEVLSQEWIDNHTDKFVGNWDLRFVSTKDLQNLLVPKQELPVIPQFVAEWLEETKPYNSLRVAFEYIAQRKRDNHDDELAFWVEEGNSEAFARAWLDGYTVEKEPKYYAKVKGWGINGNDGRAYYSGEFPLSLTMSTESVAHTKDEWRNYGVYEDNADFVKVEEEE